MRVGIVGLGYVGLPLALQFVRKGIKVIGFDTDWNKCAMISAGQSYIRYIESEEIRKAVSAEGGYMLEATPQFDLIDEQDAVIICVPTPLTKHREPDIQYILEAGKSIGPHIKKGQLIVLESTTYPGTTDDELRPVLESLSGMHAGFDFHLAFSPEREDPGNPKFNTGNIPKVVGGMTPKCQQLAMELYLAAGIKVVGVSSNRAAEATKLLENIFRCVNIALVNELKTVFDKMDIDIWEVVDAAKTKPFGYMPFYPGPGLGGHCIPIDPFYLTWKAREYGIATKFIELAGEVNTDMPHFVVDKLIEALSARGKPLNGALILIIGVAYKKDVEDFRESPSFAVWKQIAEKGGIVAYHDPYVPQLPFLHEHPDFSHKKSVELAEEMLEMADAVMILTDHSKIDYERVVRHANVVVDTRNACKGLEEALAAKVVKA